MITVAGEALIDLVDEGGGRYRAHPGGSPANVAVGLARLGVPCSMLARVSTDALGGQLTKHLAGNGVSLRDVVRAAEPTTLALASLDGAGQAAYSFYVQGTADWQWRRGELPGVLAPDVRALHAGSLALALPPGARAVEDLLAAERVRGGVTISIDPNIRPGLAARRAEEVARVERQIPPGARSQGQRGGHRLAVSRRQSRGRGASLAAARAAPRRDHAGRRRSLRPGPGRDRGPAARQARPGRGHRGGRRCVLRGTARRAVAAWPARRGRRFLRAPRRCRRPRHPLRLACPRRPGSPAGTRIRRSAVSPPAMSLRLSTGRSWLPR